MVGYLRGGIDATPPPFLTYERLPPSQRPAVSWVRWGRHDSPFGPVLAAACERGLCWLGFIMTDLPAALARLAKDWPNSPLIEDREATRAAVDLAFAGTPPSRPLTPPLPLVVRGTPFQGAVWGALLRIPSGVVVSYGDIAEAIGRPAAVRAVGGAVGANPISVLIPCHRVILKSGALHHYGWGVARKRALLAWEGVIDGHNPSTSAIP